MVKVQTHRVNHDDMYLGFWGSIFCVLCTYQKFTIKGNEDPNYLCECRLESRADCLSQPVVQPSLPHPAPSCDIIYTVDKHLLLAFSQFSSGHGTLTMLRVFGTDYRQNYD